MVKNRMRRGEQPRDPGAIVLRGDALDEECLSRDAAANFAIYGFYGLSVWVPGADVSEVDILEGKLVKAQIIVRFVAGDLYARNLLLWDTGLFPHYDGVYLMGDKLDELVRAITDAPSTSMINPYHDPDGGPER